MPHRSFQSDANDRRPRSPLWLTITLVVCLAGIAWYQSRERRVDPVRPIASPQSATGTDESSHPSEPVHESSADNQQVVAEAKPVAPGATSVSNDSASKDETVTESNRSPKEARAGPSATPEGLSVPKVSTKPSSGTSPETASTDSTSDGKATKFSARIENQTVRDFGRVVYRGTIDLQPTLDRIARGERNSHRNDGSTFGNRERRLPQKPSGYYTEYVHPTKGINGPGPQRVILGRNGEVWYTPDHYETFKKIK